MQNPLEDPVRRLALICQIQAAAMVAREEGAEPIAFELEAIIDALTPDLQAAV